MLSAGDVIAAKLLVQLGDVGAEPARAAMLAVDAAPADARDVIARLQDEGALDQAKVTRARRYVALYEAVRLEGMYVSHLEKRAGFQRAEVHELLAQLEVDVYRRRLGALLVESGRLSEDEDRAVQARVREVVRKDDERVLARYRAEAFAGVARPLLPGVTAIDAGVFRVPVVFRSARTQKIVKAAVQRLLEGAAPPPLLPDVSQDPLVELDPGGGTRGTSARRASEVEASAHAWPSSTAPRPVAAPLPAAPPPLPARPAPLPAAPAPLPARPEDPSRSLGLDDGEGERTLEVDAPAARPTAGGDDADGGERTVEVDAPAARPDTGRLRVDAAPDGGALGQDLRRRGSIGPYAVVECLGQGGMGAVYLGRDEREGALVAVKVLLADRAAPADRARFKRESDLLDRMRHPSVVNLIDAGRTDDGLDYMVIPAYPGRSLRAVLRDARASGGGAPGPSAVASRSPGVSESSGGLGVADGLETAALLLDALHGVHTAGVVHRDLKPENVFVLPGRERSVRLLDFGIARPLGDDALPPERRAFRTQSGVISGSPAYVAPETVTGDPIDGRTDVYSLGVLLFELLTGRLPLTADTPLDFLRAHLLEPPLALAQARRDMGWAPELEAFVARLLAKERDQRPTAGEALAALRGGLIDVAVRAAKAGPAPAGAPRESGVGGFFRRLGRSWS